MKTSRWSLGVALILAGVATACSSSSGSATSGDESDITSGDIVAGNSPYYWANVSFDDHVRAMTNAQAGSFDHILSDDDPLRVRIQAWADRFDAAMRARTGNKVAPKPIIKLLQSAHTFNAWSSGTLVRLGVPFGPALAEGQSPTMALLGLSNSRSTPADWSGLESFFTQPKEWTNLQSFTQVWNLNKGPCKLSSAGGRLTAVSADSSCVPEGTTASDVGVFATSPFVTFATDYVSILDETSLAATLAHELGHFYRAHSSPLVSRKYDFWYENDDGSKGPVPSAESETLRATYARVIRPVGALDSIEGAKLHVRTRLPLVVLGTNDVFSDCADVAAWTQSHDIWRLRNSVFAMPGADPEIPALYLSYEEAVLRCPTSLTFGAEDEKGPSWTAAGNVLRQNVEGVDGLGVPEMGESVVGYVQRVDGVAATLEVEEAAFATKLKAGRIGLYTVEQEADEISLELIARVGIDPEEGLRGWLKEMKSIESLGYASNTSESGNATAEQCEKWLDQGFTEKDASGNAHPVLVTIGDLNEPHHGNCYRLFNLWRELNSHRYRYVKDSTPPTFTQPWSELQAHAVELTNQAREQGF